MCEHLLDFGKHKGRRITQVDDGYLRWMLKSFPKSSKWQNAAANALRVAPDEKGIRVLMTDLKSCRDLQLGRRIHATVTDNGDPYVATALIRMYARCGSMVEARQVFDSIQKPDVVAWTALLSGYAENGEGQVSLELLSRMKENGCPPNPVTFVAALKACTSLAFNAGESGKAQALDRGRDIHSDIGVRMDSYVQSALIDMYSKCGSMLEARQVFDTIRKPDAVSWTALLLGYAENGQGHTALDLFSRMKSDGCVPNSVTYVAALKACASLAVNGDGSDGLERGRKIHLSLGNHLTPSVQSTLIDMYSKCGSMLDARQVFDSIPKPDTVSWNALLLGYVQNGSGRTSLKLFSKMKTDGCVPDSVTYVAALKACTSLAVNGGESEGLRSGRKIHSETGHHLDLHIQNTLIDMYATCGRMSEARRVFDSIQKPNVVSWNAVILGYAENSQGDAALNIFSRMKAAAFVPDSVTYVAALKACASLTASGGGRNSLDRGREIHLEIGGSLTPHLQSALIDMYAKCRSMVEARQVFETIQKPDVVSWTALLLGYAVNGQGHVCLEMFSKMQAGECAPDSLTYIAVLKACGSVGALTKGRKFHNEMSKFSLHVVTCLVDFYAKCGSMVEAHAVFDEYSKFRDITTWNALLSGYSSYGDTASVFNLFQGLQDTGVRLDRVIFMSVLACCSHAGLVEKAKGYLDSMSEQYEVTPDVFHYNCMVDVLGRAKQLNEAVSVLRRMPCNLNAVAWITLLGACHRWKNAQLGRLAFQSLVEMDKTDGAAYTLMARTFSHTWSEPVKIRKEHWRLGEAYVANETGKMVKFVIGEEDLPEIKVKLAQLQGDFKELCHNREGTSTTDALLLVDLEPVVHVTRSIVPASRD